MHYCRGRLQTKCDTVNVNVWLQAVITSVWASATVVASTFGYTTMRTGAHMADTGTEHNIELILASVACVPRVHACVCVALNTVSDGGATPLSACLKP